MSFNALSRPGIIPISTKIGSIQSDYLYISDEYALKKWEFDFCKTDDIVKGNNDCFCFTIVRNGHFFFDIMHRKSDMLHIGHVIVEKPGIEFRVRPSSGKVTIFNFSDKFYQELIEDHGSNNSGFFGNKDKLSVVLQTTPAIDYLHYAICKAVYTAEKLEMDTLVFEIASQVYRAVSSQFTISLVDKVPAKSHLASIEQAKEYMNEHFACDISLEDVAQQACISPFHFSRIFKEITGNSPHQYLTSLRLRHAELLLKYTTTPVKDIGYSSGFLNPDYFSYAFKTKYKISPVKFRTKAGSTKISSLLSVQ